MKKSKNTNGYSLASLAVRSCIYTHRQSYPSRRVGHMPQIDAGNPDPDSLLLRRVRRQNQRRSAARFAFRGGAREVWRMKKNSDSANRFLGHGWAGGRVSWAAGPAHVDLAETAGA